MASTSALFSHDAQRVFDDIDRHFQLSKETLVELTQAFIDEYRLGLGSYGKPMAMMCVSAQHSLRASPMVRRLGKSYSFNIIETGFAECAAFTAHFLPLTWGHQSVSYITSPQRRPPIVCPIRRVCEVVLNGDKTFSLRQQKYRVSEELKTGEATALFDYLADSVDAFLTENTPSEPIPPMRVPTMPIPGSQDVVHLGLTFSFPVEQTALGAGKILTWTKGFSAKNAIGHDVVQLLQDAFDRKHLHVKCVALRSHLPSTPFDNALDRRSINPRFQAFEKFVSGMYLGEIARNIIMALIDAAPKPLLLSGKFTPLLNTQWGLDTSVMSDIENAWEEEKRTERSPEDVMPLFTEFDESKLSENVKARLQRIVKWACGLVARRAALLSGVAVAATLIQTGRASLPAGHDNITNSEGAEDEEKIGVGVDGSLIEHYPHFEHMMRESLKILVGEHIEKRVDIGMAKDGSGVGGESSFYLAYLLYY
ncbi:glucokinase [Salix suchowensis]|nr:glucokinase [Salix suchowensis]